MSSDFRNLLADPLESLLSSLAMCVSELAGFHRELSQVLLAEKQAKAQAWMGSDETSIQGRDRAADHFALALSCDVIKLKGDIAACQEERDFLLLLIDLKRSSDA